MAAALRERREFRHSYIGVRSSEDTGKSERARDKIGRALRKFNPGLAQLGGGSGG